MLIIFLLSFFGYTDTQCAICSWPFNGKANQLGECFLTSGFQTDLQGTCHNYCMQWATDIVSDVPYVVSSDNYGGCICQRHSPGASGTEYKTRPQKTCLVWGWSDDVINNRKEFSSSAISNTTQNNNDLPSINYLSDNGYSGVGYMYGSINASIDGGSIYGSIDLRPLNNELSSNINTAFQGAYYRDIQIYDSIVNKTSSKFDSLNLRLNNSDSVLFSVASKLDGVLTSSSLDAAKQDLMYAINSKSGSSSSPSDPTDLSGVLNAIGAARAANLEATGGVQSSVDAMNTNLSARIGAVGDSVSSLGGKLDGIGRVIDSGASSRWRLDHDSANMAASGVRSEFDSVKASGAGGGGWTADSTSALSSSTASNQSHLTDINSSLESMKTLLLGNSCTEFPSWPVSIMGLNFDLGSNFNAWPLIFTLMRFLGRFAGAFMGFKVVFWAITRGGDNAASAS